MKTFFKTGCTRTWFIVTVLVVALLIAINVVAGYFAGMINGVAESVGLGADIEASGDYERTYETKEEATAAGNALTVEAADEGFVLLKNEGGALPLDGSAKISVFGKNSARPAYGGSGSGSGNTANAISLYQGLENAGFELNPELIEFYQDDARSGSGRGANPGMNDLAPPGFATGETPVSSYDTAVTGSYSEYSDAALIVITRIGGEGFDLPRTMATSWGGGPVTGARSADDHYLQLDQNETDLIEHVCAQNFDHVIVVLNCGVTMELGFLDDPDHYAYNEKIDGALWIGFPGNAGMNAVGRVLSGQVNPSGHTVDTFAREFKQDPSWENFSTNLTSDGNAYIDERGRAAGYYFVDYEESIYVGYRYYETRGFTDGEAWYEDHVVYPFGYGLSYTTFETELVTAPEGALSKEPFDVTVRVTNTGDVAGKDVVQLYVTAPYTEGEIEKAHKVLVGFAKTGLLERGASEELTITVDPYYFASYDYNDANGNDFCGYELDAGDYVFTVAQDAHSESDAFTLQLSDGLRYETDPVTGTAVVNRYDDADDHLQTLLSRADWEGTWPAAPTQEDRLLTEEVREAIRSTDSGAPSYVDPEEPVPADAGTMLADLQGAEYDDERWYELLNRITTQEMLDLHNQGGFQTIAIDSIGKSQTYDSDGPAGWVNFVAGFSQRFEGTCTYAAEIVFACTWNTDILHRFGQMVGEEALTGYTYEEQVTNDDGTTETVVRHIPYTGWYAPAMNIHRSAFGGRNWEYYGEDPYLSGKLAAAQITGLREKGVIPYVKHFAVNEQETTRNAQGLVTWVTEQSMREIYLRPFEIAVKEGKTNGMMSSFNRIGTRWAGGDYRLLTTILRDEWGFEGAVICDYDSATPYMDNRQMASAGGDLTLGTDMSAYWRDFDENNPEDVAILRNAVKNILYATANSTGVLVSVRSGMAKWQILLYVLDAVIPAGLVVWGVFAVLKAYRKPKTGEQAA